MIEYSKLKHRRYYITKVNGRYYKYKYIYLFCNIWYKQLLKIDNILENLLL